MKTAVSIIIIILSLITFAFVGVLLNIEYKQVQQEFISLLGADATSEVTVGRIEIDKFPTPRLIAYNIKIPGVLEADKMVVNFSLMSILQRKPHITNIEVNQTGLDFNLIVQYEGDKLSYGKATIRTGHIAQFLKGYPDLQELMRTVIPAHNTDLIFDLVASNEYLTFTNLGISSAVLKCSGEIALSRTDKLNSKMQLTCDKVQLVDEELNKVIISGNSDQDGLHLTAASGNIASGGSFDLFGDLTKNAYRSIFEGKIKLKHNDINIALAKLGMKSLAVSTQAETEIDSGFRITPVEFSLHDLKGQIGLLGIAGHSDVKFIGDTPRLFANFSVTGFDSGAEYPAISPMLNYFSSFFRATEDRSYIAKFVPVRNIDFLSKYKISLTSPVIAGKAIDSLDISGNAAAGKLEVSSFSYLDGNEHLEGSISLDTISMKPIFNFNITGGSLSTENLTVTNLLAINSSLKDADLSKINLIADISLDSLSQGDTKLEGLKFSLQNEGNIITFPHLSATVGASDIQLNGNITVASPMSINLAYVYNSADLGRAPAFFGVDLNLKGIANFAGIISTNGTSPEELLYNLSTKSKFIASQVDLREFSIDDLVTKLSNLKYDKSQLDEDVKLATSSGVTSFNGITGSFTMDTGVLYLKDVIFASKYTSATLGTAYNIYNQDLSFSSLWSFQFPLATNSSSSASIGMSMERKGQDTRNNIDTGNLLKLFSAREIQGMIPSAGGAVMTPPPISPSQPQ